MTTKERIVRMLRDAADAIERDEPKGAWNHVKMIVLTTPVQNVGGMVTDLRYDGSILLLSNIPIVNEVETQIRRIYSQHPITI